MGACVFFIMILPYFFAHFQNGYEIWWIRGIFMDLSTSKQRNFVMKEALGKKCNSYVDVKSSQESKKDT